MIPVTKTFLPPIEEYSRYLEQIWASNQVTNHGPLVKELEEQLKDYLGVKHLLFVSNGTIALQIAIKALDLHNEVITTPFSYVATTSSLVWEGCQPVFVDIDPHTLCIDPDLLEAAITEKTTGILATHVYGIPCDVERIQTIAKNHGLKVLYDAAHTFGGKYQGKSIVSYGDVATLSFHATKVFHTVEGGAIITDDDELAHRISYIFNFGHNGPNDFWGIGINGKNSELHAAMGLCVLPKVPKLIAKRKSISERYDKLLEGSGLIKPILVKNICYNFAYYSLLFETENSLLKTLEALNKNNIYPRRYFYPSLNKLPYVNYRNMPIAEDVSSRVLCLPSSPYLTENEVEKITSVIINTIN